MEKFNAKTYHDNKEELHGTIYQQTKKKKRRAAYLLFRLTDLVVIPYNACGR